MIHELDSQQVDAVLHEATIGHIGCQSDGRVYVVPVTYAYEDGCVYAHSAVGRKVRMMRADPEVCFETEVVEDLARWRSVIAWGTYEELDGEEAEHGMQVLMERFMPLMTRESAVPTHGLHGHPGGMGTGSSVIFRLRLREKTGREEV